MIYSPKVSIIIAIFNGEKFIESTILSIINQSYKNIELIVIDGGSTDKTLTILKKYSCNITKLVSEKDKGISDAFNKGVLLSTGDYINFQGDGDGFTSTSILNDLMKQVANIQPDIISSRIKRIDHDGSYLYNSKYIRNFKKRSLLFKMSLPHQGLLIRKQLFEKYGLFDLDCKYAMDYDHLLRMYKNFPNTFTSDIILAYWRNDGIGTNNTRSVLNEYNIIKIKNHVAPKFIIAIINQWTLFKFNLKTFFRKV